MEAVIIGLTLLTPLWLMAQWLGWLPVGPNAGLLKPVVFILYMQAGTLMLKQVFVRWRMKLPLRRVDDYRRWREAWLSYHLRVFDAMRLLLAFYLWAILAFKSFRLWWGAEQMKPPGLAMVLISIAVYLFYCSRERRRLAVVEREIKPQRVRTATVAGVAPPDMKLPLPFGKGVQNALEHVFADCAADEKCRAAFPRPMADLETAGKLLEKAPALLHLPLRR